MEFKHYRIDKDLIIIGAGVPGICAAIQAARLGLSVALINNRGYLGGNSSAEIGVSVDGADGAQEFNHYSREAGIVDELRIEDLYRNPQKNRYIWDTVLIDAVRKEPNIQVFLNTNIDKVEMNSNKEIQYVSGSQLGSEKRFDFYGHFFLDDTGDGTVGYLSGAEYRMGREAKSEFNERIAPDKADDYVIPSTLTFHAADTGKPIRYIRPDFAIDLTKTDVLKYRVIPKNEFWRFHWFYEATGKINQIENSEEIIQMHRELVYGIWDYVKNSGEYPSEQYDLIYVAPVPGKRESRRLMGDYILKESDIVEQKDFEDTVGHGGWSIDLHALDGFFSKDLVNEHIFLKGIYQIPYRTGYSRNIDNLFMAGRCMSTTHVAFGTTRVMATLSTLGQALGAAAYLCCKYDTTPRGVYKNHIKELQQLLLKYDQYIVGVKNEDPKDMARKAEVRASSIRKCMMEEDEDVRALDNTLGFILPADGLLESVSLKLKASADTELRYKVYEPVKKENYNPENKIAEGVIKVKSSESFIWVDLPVNRSIDKNKIFIEIEANPVIKVAYANKNLTGVVTMEKVSNKGATLVDIDTLKMKEFIWRTLKTTTLCFRTKPEQDVYKAENIINGYARPYGLPNIWLSDDKVEGEFVSLSWPEKKSLSEIILYLDSDLNHRIHFRPADNNLIPEIVKDYNVYYKSGDSYTKLHEVRDNHHRVNRIDAKGVQTDEIKIEFLATNGCPRVGLYEVRVYGME
ncbi:MAG TPA: FAD-dependent oxidoreductase [Clostridiales bacterium]|nr:FAD-dependent oxidoreductase [Clostridiales bacterium]